ncbi:hypothetical protein [Fulvivirga sp. M361]|nr:hypothetical protein [Fulvivirga sp. M361]
MLTDNEIENDTDQNLIEKITSNRASAHISAVEINSIDQLKPLREAFIK